MRSLLSLAWRDLRGGGRTLWVFCACLMLGVTLIAAKPVAGVDSKDVKTGTDMCWGNK